MLDEFFDFGFNFRTIFLIVCLAASAIMLIYYYFKNGHKRLRPRPGEMALFSLLAVMICFGLSSVVGGLLDDPEQIKLDPKLTEIIESSPMNEEEVKKADTEQDQRSRIRQRERQSTNASEGKRESNFKF